jgi:hypothetical protein
MSMVYLTYMGLDPKAPGSLGVDAQVHHHVSGDKHSVNVLQDIEVIYG